MNFFLFKDSKSNNEISIIAIKLKYDKSTKTCVSKNGSIEKLPKTKLTTNLKNIFPYFLYLFSINAEFIDNINTIAKFCINIIDNLGDTLNPLTTNNVINLR